MNQSTTRALALAFITLCAFCFGTSAAQAAEATKNVNVPVNNALGEKSHWKVVSAKSQKVVSEEIVYQDGHRISRSFEQTTGKLSVENEYQPIPGQSNSYLKRVTYYCADGISPQKEEKYHLVNGRRLLETSTTWDYDPQTGEPTTVSMMIID